MTLFQLYPVNEDVTLIHILNIEPSHISNIPCIMDMSTFEIDYKICYFYFIESSNKSVKIFEKLNGKIENSTFIINTNEVEKIQIRKVSCFYNNILIQ